MKIWKISDELTKREMVGFSRQTLNGLQEIHKHEFMEIEYVARGRIIQNINGEYFESGKGRYFFFHVGDEHSFYTKGEAVVVNVIFYPELYKKLFGQEGFLYNRQRLMNVIDVGEESEKLEQLFALIEEEFSEKRENYVYIVHHFLYIIFSILLRNNEKKLGNIEDVEFMTSCEKYINRYLEEMNVQSLAAYCGYTREHFSKKFKMNFGVSPLEYINRKRIYTALNYIVTTNSSIEFIMKKIGMVNKTHFYKMFLRYVGKYPTEIRKNKNVDKIRYMPETEQEESVEEKENGV